MVRHAIPLTLLALTLSLPAAAQTEEVLEIGGDVYRAGQTVTLDAPGADDAWLAGETVRALADLGGDLHAAGRWVTVEGAVGGTVHAGGQIVTLEGAVAGDATVLGMEVTLGDVAGDVRAMGSEVTLRGDIGGYAIAGGEFVRVEGRIAGDLLVSARDLDFGPDAEVAGEIRLYEEEDGALDVPGGVAEPDRITRRTVEEWETEMSDYSPVSTRWLVGKFLWGVMMVTALAALIAAIMPDRLARFREAVLERPVRGLVIGFLGLSALIGSVFVFGMTLVGLLLVPGILLVAGLAGFAGYVIGAYVLGVAILRQAGRELPASFADRAIAGGVGALAAALIALLPFLGWLFVLALTLTGFGAILIVWVRPRFFTT